MTRSSWPDHTAAAALKFVCIEEPHWRSTVVPHTRDRPAGGERDVAADVPGLLADLGDAAPLQVLDLAGVDLVPRDQAVHDLRRELVAADMRKRAVLAADRAANGVDDQGF